MSNNDKVNNSILNGPKMDRITFWNAFISLLFSNRFRNDMSFFKSMLIPLNSKILTWWVNMSNHEHSDDPFGDWFYEMHKLLRNTDIFHDTIPHLSSMLWNLIHTDLGDVFIDLMRRACIESIENQDSNKLPFYQSKHLQDVEHLIAPFLTCFDSISESNQSRWHLISEINRVMRYHDIPETIVYNKNRIELNTEFMDLAFDQCKSGADSVQLRSLSMDHHTEQLRQRLASYLVDVHFSADAV